MSTRYSDQVTTQYSRFSIGAFAVVAGGFLAVISRTFAGGSLEWTAFGVSAAVALAGIVGLTINGAGRGSAARIALTLLGGWSLVAALVFNGSALGWLVLADALAVAAVAIADLVAHEVTTERVVHTLDVNAGTRSESEHTLAA